MSLEIKGKITFKRDASTGVSEWTIACPQLNIEIAGNGDLDSMVDRLTEAIREKIVEEFKTRPKTVQIIKYSLGATFSLEGPINHTLTNFPGKAKGATS